MLDTIANRCFAAGTNAWTATDHTVFLHFDITYRRHIPSQPLEKRHSFEFFRCTLITSSMRPCIILWRITLTNRTSSGCLTEVYHINGEGKDAGVVYSEMQGRQNQSGDLMELATQRLMYPEGIGYRSETGGLMEALRVLDVQTIRE
jgi:hypothetical protein